MQLHEFGQGIRPRTLTEGGLRPALAELARQSSVPVEVDVPDGRFAPAQELVAYFVCSEALANVAKYADASQARMTVIASAGRAVDHGRRRRRRWRGRAARLRPARSRGPRRGARRAAARGEPGRRRNARRGFAAGDWKRRSVIWDDRAVVYRVVAWTVALSAAAVTVAVVRDEPSDSLAGDSVLALTAEVAAGLLLVAAASAARAPAAFRVLLAAAGVAWLIGEWNSPGAGAAFSAGLVLYAAWPALLAHAALRYGERSLSRPAIALLAVAYADSLLVLGAGSAVLLRPARAGLPRLPRQPPAGVRAPAGGARPRARGAARRVRHGRRRSPCSFSFAWRAPRRPAGGWSCPSSSPPRPPSRCSEPAPCTAPSAASSPTTRRIARCGPRRSPRSRWWPPSVAWQRAARAAHARPARPARRRPRPVTAAGRPPRPAGARVRRSLARAAPRPR